MTAPIIGIVCTLESLDIPGFGPLRHHAVFSRYLEGLLTHVDASPILIPAVGRSGQSSAEVLAVNYTRLVDGLFLPGAVSNVAPELYGGDYVEDDPAKLDHDRDATVMPLIRAALRAGVPILGACRGMQELNVALGGTLTRAVHEVPGRRDHRSRKDRPFLERYHAAHPLRLASDGLIEREMLARGHDTDDLSVNSLHAQAVDRLGRGVVVEAWADDGTIEAIRVENAPGMALGVQWHIEWHTKSTPLHATLLDAFGRACTARAERAER